MQRLAGLAADVEGDDDGRPPLVLLHGLTFDRTMWRPVVEQLATVDPARRVVAFDLPGHGASNAQASYDVESVAATVHRAVEEASLESPVMVGHSVAGVVVTAYAARYAARGVVNVDMPLLIAPFAEMVRSIEEQLRGPNFAEVWEMIAASFHTELLPPEAQAIVRATSRPRQDVVLGYWSEVVERPVAELTSMIESRLAHLRDARTPYVIVAGSELDAAYEQWLRKVLPQASVSVWPDSGHFPHLANPAAFAKKLAETATW